ncbi:hypothetical protein SESBI_13684 [Sesbania bispinosa]|nr:hypothetical protein SESBI_13684 [Sesbania bispinosa]
MAERLVVSGMGERGFERFDVVEEGGDCGMGLVLVIFVREKVVVSVRFEVELSGNKVRLRDEE